MIAMTDPNWILMGYPIAAVLVMIVAIIHHCIGETLRDWMELREARMHRIRREKIGM